MVDETVKILIADPNPIIREGLRNVFQSSPNLRVVAESAGGYATIVAASTTQPDIIILDDNLGDMDAYECVQSLLKEPKKPYILVCYSVVAPLEIQQLIQIGVTGFAAKNATSTEIINAVRLLATGGSYFSSSISKLLFANNNAQRSYANTGGLTKKELEVLSHLAAGMSNKEAARRLELSVRTVEAHRLSIRRKTKKGRLKDLIQLARRLNLEPVRLLNDDEQEPPSDRDTDAARQLLQPNHFENR